MNTLQTRPEVSYPAQTKEWSAVNTIIALILVAVLGGILYCIGYLQSPLPGTLTSRDSAKRGDSAWKATAPGSSNLPLPMPLPFPMPLQVPAPVVDQSAGDSIHVDSRSARVGTAHL